MDKNRMIQLGAEIAEVLAVEGEREFAKAWKEFLTKQRNHFIASRLKVIIQDEEHLVFGDELTSMDYSIFSLDDPENSKTVNEYSNFNEVKDDFVYQYVRHKFSEYRDLINMYSQPNNQNNLWKVPCKETTEAIEGWRTATSTDVERMERQKAIREDLQPTVEDLEAWQRLAENHEYKFPANPIPEKGLGDVLGEMLEEELVLRKEAETEDNVFDPDDFFKEQDTSTETIEETPEPAGMPEVLPPAQSTLFPIVEKNNGIVHPKDVTHHTVKTFLDFFDKGKGESRLSKWLVNSLISKLGRACLYAQAKQGILKEGKFTLKQSTEFEKFAREYDRYYNL